MNKKLNKRDKLLLKLTQIMKVTITFMLIGNIHASATTYAEEHKVSVHVKNGTFYDVVTQIEKQSEFMFFYKSEEIDNNLQITLNATDKLVPDILNEVLKNHGLSYEIHDKHIIISKSRPIVAQQQGRRITGTVIDELGETIIGANIIERGTTNGVITDINGQFTLTVQENAVLQISFIGYIPQEIPVRDQTNISITMVEDARTLDELVVTGYSTQRKRDLTGAVAVVKLDEVENIVTSNIMQSLQGQVPGLFITSSGNPTGSADILIRGVSTLGTSTNQSARSAPLYIIDGVPTMANMNTLSAQDIESIQVLKDASASSIYGSRASNGVIIITTKKADQQTTSVNVRSSMTVRTYTEKPLNWLNTYERGWVWWRASRNDGTNPNTGGWPYSFVDHQDANGNWVLERIELPEWIDYEQTMKSADTDWVSEIMQPSITQNYSVTVSTGGAKGRSLLALDYLDNVGQVKGTYNNRMSLRLNSDYSLINNKLTVGETLSITKTKRNLLNASTLLTQTRVLQPIIPIRRVDGIGWGGNYGAMDDDAQNPLRMIEWNKDNFDHIMRLFGNVYLDLEIIKNLHFKTTLGLDQEFSWRRDLQKAYRDGGFGTTYDRVDSRFNRSGTFIWNNTLTYALNFGYHNINFLLGHEQLDVYTENQSYTRDEYDSTDPNYMYIFAGGSAIVPTSGNANSATQSRLLSYFGKVDYVYNDRYLASFTLRRDGSSRFGANNRFATFPAFSLGWRLSEEGFFKNAVPIFSDLKLRYGWGQTGNQTGIDDFAAYGLYQAVYFSAQAGAAASGYDQSTAYDIQGIGTGTRPMGYRRSQMENTTLKWETSTQNNLGIDFGLFDQKLTGSAEYFFIETTDILVTPPSLAVLGEGSERTVNGATMENKGFEFLLSYRHRLGDLRYTVSANLSSYSNKVTHLPNEVISQYAGNGIDKTIIGRPRSSVFGYYADGIFKSQAEVDAHVTQSGKGVGRIRYRDIAGPGATADYTPPPDGSITTADRDFIGKTDPDFIYGLSINLQYKQWDFTMFWNGVQGSYAYVNNTKRNEQFVGGAIKAGQNYGKSTLDAWSFENPTSDIPRLSTIDTNLETGTRLSSTFFYENTSYFKLRNVEIGYTLPRAVLSKIHTQNARVYLVGQNLLKFFKKSGSQAFTGADPETPGTAYPIPLSLTVGLNVTF